MSRVEESHHGSRHRVSSLLRRGCGVAGNFICDPLPHLNDGVEISGTHFNSLRYPTVCVCVCACVHAGVNVYSGT